MLLALEEFVDNVMWAGLEVEGVFVITEISR